MAGSPARRASAPLGAVAGFAAAGRLVAVRPEQCAGRRAVRARHRAGRGAHAVQAAAVAGLIAPAGRTVLAGPAAGPTHAYARAASHVRRRRERPRSLSDDLACHTATKRRARRSSRHRCARPAHDLRHCPPSRRWRDRYASRCRRTADRCRNPARRSSQAPRAGPPSLTRQHRRRGQARGASSISSITVRASRPLLAPCAQPRRYPVRRARRSPDDRDHRPVDRSHGWSGPVPGRPRRTARAADAIRNIPSAAAKMIIPRTPTCVAWIVMRCGTPSDWPP